MTRIYNTLVSIARIGDLGPDSPLRRRAWNASVWTVGANLANQVIRLVSNLILTRLLFPEAFGVMAIIQSFMVGLALLTDLGIESSVIQKKRGGESEFLNSAWTINVIQGIFIWVVLCLLAPHISSFYGEPMLRDLLPVAGFGAVLGGMTSINLAFASRSLNLRVRVLIETGTYAFGVVVMIFLAWEYKSVWSIVWGGLVGSAAKTILSHFFAAGPVNRLFLEWKSVKEILSFGKWVLVGSALTFLVGEGNKLILGKLLGIKELALYTLASVMSLVFWQVAQQVCGRVFFPAYSEIVRERPEKLRAMSLRCRLSIIVPGWLIAFFFTQYGGHLMRFLYDQRYHHSGYILEILGMGMLVRVIGASYNGLLLAKGMARTNSFLVAVEFTAQILAIIVGNHLMGGRGVILGMAFASWLLYPVQVFVYAKINLWEPKVDVPLILISILVVCFNSEKLIS